MQSAKELLGFNCSKVDKVQDLTFDIEQMAPVFKRVDDEVFGRNWKIVAVGSTLQKHCEKSSLELMVSETCFLRMA